jgi:hypothetical protein
VRACAIELITCRLAFALDETTRARKQQKKQQLV